MSTFVTRPRGEAMAELRLQAATPPVATLTDPTPLHDLVESWRIAAAGGDEARPCACGHVVIANGIDPTPGVRDHQATNHHRAWSRRVYG